MLNSVNRYYVIIVLPHSKQCKLNNRPLVLTFDNNKIINNNNITA